MLNSLCAKQLEAGFGLSVQQDAQQAIISPGCCASDRKERRLDLHVYLARCGH